MGFRSRFVQMDRMIDRKQIDNTNCEMQTSILPTLTTLAKRATHIETKQADWNLKKFANVAQPKRPVRELRVACTL